MTKRETLEQIKNLYEEWKHTQEYILPHRIIEVFELYLKQNPYDTWMWLEYAEFVDYPPCANYHRALDYIRHALSYDPNNGYAWALLTYKLEALIGIDEQTYMDLCKAKNDNLEEMGLIELSKARYLDNIEDFINYEKALLKSIEYAPHFSLNFLKLGSFYGRNSDPLIREQKIPLMWQGISNILEVYLSHINFSKQFLSLQRFFDGDITGIRINEGSYKALIKINNYDPTKSIRTS